MFNVIDLVVVVELVEIEHFSNSSSKFAINISLEFVENGVGVVVVIVMDGFENASNLAAVAVVVGL